MHRGQKYKRQHSGQMSPNIQNRKEKIEIQLVSSTEVCGKVLSEKNGYKSVKTSLLLSNIIDTDHQNSCLFTSKDHFSSLLWVYIGVLANFHE